MLRYEFIVAPKPNDLNHEVNEKLAQGWKLYGDPVMTCDDSYNWYGQAMTFWKPDPDPDHPERL